MISSSYTYQNGKQEVLWASVASAAIRQSGRDRAHACPYPEQILTALGVPQNPRSAVVELEQVAIRLMHGTAASQARVSTSFSFAETTSQYIAAARSPPRSKPANSRAFLPRAVPRSARCDRLFCWHRVQT